MPQNVSDEAFARAAQLGGVASYDDVEAARAVQAESARKGIVVSLADVLVQQGVITAKTRENIEKKALAQQAGGLTQLGPYKLIKKLGEGGMGAVYLAEDLNAGRKVAVKVLPKKTASDPEFLSRFRREAKAAGALNHVNIVGAYTIGEDQGFHFIAMEYCEGEPLDKVLKRDGLMPCDKALEIIIQVARGLKHAHDHGFIHRDIKPANIMLCRPLRSTGETPVLAQSTGETPVLQEGFVAKILDLGLSKNVGADEQSFVTQTNVALGTPHYISPEQAKGNKDIDGRTDIYSLGVTFYHLVTGQTPFQGATSAIIMAQHVNQKLQNPQVINTEVPDGVAHVIQKMMAKKPSDRYGDCQKLLDDLELVRAGKTPSQMAVLARPASTRQQASGARHAMKRQAADQAESGNTSPPPGRKNVYIAAGIGALAVLALIIGLVVSGSRSNEQQAAVRAAEDKRKAEAAQTDRLAEQNRNAEESRLKNEAVRQEQERNKLANEKRKAEEAKLEEEKRKLAEERQKLEEARLAAEAKKKSETEKQPGTGTAGVKPRSEPVAPATTVQAANVAQPDTKASKTPAAQIAADARAEKAQELFFAVLKDTAPLLAQNKLADAIALLERKAKDPALADAAELLKQEGACVEAVVQLRRQTIEALRKQVGKTLALRKGGTEFKGKVTAEPKPESVTLDLGGAQMTFDLMQLSIADVDEYAPKAQGLDLRNRGLLYLYAGDVPKAKDYLTKAQEAGLGDQATRCLDRIAALEAAATEEAAQRAWRHAEYLYGANDFKGARLAYEMFKAETAGTKTLATNEKTVAERLAAIEIALPAPLRVLDLGGGVKMDMLLIRTGEFTMGANSFNDEERPAHKVRISKPFYMGKYHVTVGQFRAFVQATNYKTTAEKAGGGYICEREFVPAEGVNWTKPNFPQTDDHPVVLVTWFDAQEFCKWASKKTGKAVFLPSEAQWEYACRAGTTTRYNTGDKDSDLEQAAWCAKNSGYRTHPVGLKKPNAWGLYDMHGNAWHWVQDSFDEKYYAESPLLDPTGPKSGGQRPVRGGCWLVAPVICRSSNRFPVNGAATYTHFGFRCALGF